MIHGYTEGYTDHERILALEARVTELESQTRTATGNRFVERARKEVAIHAADANLIGAEEEQERAQELVQEQAKQEGVTVPDEDVEQVRKPRPARAASRYDS